MENSFYKDRLNLARGIFLHETTDTPVAIRLRYIGSGTVTSITTTTATNIVMITSDGGTDTYAFSTYDTVGKLADAINADGIFEAIVLDTLRSYATASQFVTGAITSSTSEEGLTIWDVNVDTSAAYYISACFDPGERGFFSIQRGKNHRVSLSQIDYTCNVGTAAADSVQIWVRNGTVETQIAGYLSVDNSATTISWASGNGKYTAKDGYQIIVLVKDAASLADGATLDIVGVLE